MDIREIAYSDVMNEDDEGCYLVDTKRKILLWNKKAEAITGFSAGEVIDHSCSDDILVHVDDNGLYMCAFGCPLADTMKNGRETSVSAYLHHKDGHRVPVSIVASPVISPDGRIIGAIERFSMKSPHRSVRSPEEPLEVTEPPPAVRGFLDRKELENDIERNLDELRSRNESFGVIMAEIRQIDNIRNKHGDTASATLVDIVTNTLKNNIDPGDALGFWNEHTFLIILDISNEDTLEEMTKKLRMLVASSFTHVDGEKASVTIVTGATLARPGDNVQTLSGRAANVIRMNRMMGLNDTAFAEENNKQAEADGRERKKREHRTPPKTGLFSNIRPGFYVLTGIMISIWIFIFLVWYTFFRYR